MEVRSEASLIEEVVRGDEASFRILYRGHESRLYRLALRLTGGESGAAEDLVQESWLRAIRGLSGFEHRSSLATWLTGIMTRCAAERYRRSGREIAADVDDVPSSRADRNAAERIDLERTFAELPFGFRTVLVLHDVEGLRHRDIAELLGISEGTSKSQLSRARRRVRETLGDDYARI